MRIGWFCPAYRSTVRIETAYTLVRDALWCEANGHELLPYYRANCVIDAARNYALRTAIDSDLDLLVMVDADVYALAYEGAVAHLLAAWQRNLEPAVVGAPVVTRREGAALNVTADGDVGTGLMLIDVRQLRQLAGPWFVTQLDDQGEVALGEDLAFCRRVRDSGLRVVVATEVETGHVGDQHLRFSPSAAAMPTSSGERTPTDQGRRLQAVE